MYNLQLQHDTTDKEYPVQPSYLIENLLEKFLLVSVLTSSSRHAPTMMHILMRGRYIFHFIKALFLSSI